MTFSLLPNATSTLEAVFSVLSDPLFIVNEDWVIAHTNPAADEAFGLGSALVGQPLADVLDEDFVVSARTGKLPTYWEYDEGRGYQPACQTIAVDAGGSVGAVVLLRVAKEASSDSEQHFDLLAFVAHDIRNPLTTLKGYADMLGSIGTLSSQQLEYHGKIMSSVDRMTRIVDNVLTAQRYDPAVGLHKMMRKQCDVTEIAKTSINRYVIPPEKQNLKLTCVSDDNIPIIRADAEMLERAIANLVDNAVKYVPDGRHVEVSVRVVEGDIRVCVADDGDGISPDNQARLFQRYVRLKDASGVNLHRVKGVGLGLFIVKTVAEWHGGEAWVESELGSGSRFYFTIPLAGDNLLSAGSAASSSD